MKRTAGVFFSLTLIIGAIAIAIARQYAGATFQDIMSALGPDALGLEISADKLPDIATLKASRYEDQSENFVVEHPYTRGRWKGGRARVEYARDLSYAIVSIYDKEGRRQRIYSVKARPSEGDVDLAAAVTAASPDASTAMPVAPVKTTVQSNQPAATLPATTATQATSPSPVPTKKKHHRRSDVPIEVAVANSHSGSDVWVPVAQPSSKVSAPVASSAIQPSASASPSAKSAPEPVPQSPVAGFVWNEDVGAYVPVNGGDQSKEKSSKQQQNGYASGSVQKTAPVAVAPPTNNAPSAPLQKIVAADVPSTDELLGAASNPVKSSIAAPAPPPAPPVVSQDDQALIAKAKRDLEQAETSSSKAANEAQTAATPPPATFANGAGPDTSESDQWVPKAVKVKPAPQAVVSQPVQVAMLPKPAPPPPDASIDGLLKIAGQNSAAAAADSDAWVPKNTALPKADADVVAELNRIKAQKPAPVPVVKINRDVNNPEEGVLPANSFEKFVGPRYGRHREYERRLMFGKKTKSKVKDYDFYVDEVDRKKEIHNVYYYKKGKVPKLVAVEKHYSVTFLSNYDVDKEDKGKISLE